MSIPQFPKVSTALLLAAFLIGCSGLSNSPAPIVSNASNAPTDIDGSPANQWRGHQPCRLRWYLALPMDPATINAGTFVVSGVAGTVTYDATNRIAAFRPSC